MLGIEVSERSVSRYLPRQRPTPGALERWIKFLRNHRDAIAAMDFFTIPTATFRILYAWFAIDHARPHGWTRIHAGVGYSTDCVKQQWRRATAGSESNHEDATVGRPGCP